MKRYYQIEIAEDDREKIACVVSHGLYEFSVMPFGLTGAPNSFRRLLKESKSALAYLDNIIVYSQSIEDDIQNLSRALEILMDAKLKINFEKSLFEQDKITYLGHVISAQGISLDPTLIKKIKDYKTPKNVKEL